MFVWIVVCMFQSVMASNCIIGVCWLMVLMAMVVFHFVIVIMVVVIVVVYRGWQ